MNTESLVQEYNRLDSLRYRYFTDYLKAQKAGDEVASEEYRKANLRVKARMEEIEKVLSNE